MFPLNLLLTFVAILLGQVWYDVENCYPLGVFSNLCIVYWTWSLRYIFLACIGLAGDILYSTLYPHCIFKLMMWRAQIPAVHQILFKISADDTV